MNPASRSQMEEIVRGLCLGILLVCGLASWAILSGPDELAKSPIGLIAAALLILLLAWVWLYRWGREGVRWQYGCGYVGFVVISVNLYAKAFFAGGGTWLMTMIGGAGVVYGLIPMVRRASDAQIEATPPSEPSPVAATHKDSLEARNQTQVLALLILLGWSLLVWTNLDDFVNFMTRREGKVVVAYVWMVIGGVWWFSMGRRGVTAKSLVASASTVFMAANLCAEAFVGGGSWVVVLLALLANLAALTQWLPNRGMEALPRSPTLDGPAPQEAEPVGHHVH